MSLTLFVWWGRRHGAGPFKGHKLRQLTSWVPLCKGQQDPRGQYTLRSGSSIAITAFIKGNNTLLRFLLQLSSKNVANIFPPAKTKSLFVKKCGSHCRVMTLQGCFKKTYEIFCPHFYLYWKDETLASNAEDHLGRTRFPKQALSLAPSLIRYRCQPMFSAALWGQKWPHIHT